VTGPNVVSDKSKFIQDVQLAVDEGDLATFLVSVNQNSNVYILTGVKISPVTPQIGITSVGVAIIVGATFFVLIILFVGWFVLHRPRKNHTSDENVISSLDLPLQNASGNQQNDNSDITSDGTKTSPLDHEATSSESRSHVMIFADSSSNEGSNPEKKSPKATSTSPEGIEVSEKVSGESRSTLGVTSSFIENIKRKNG
jgi:hypothetical protein